MFRKKAPEEQTDEQEAPAEQPVFPIKERKTGGFNPNPATPQRVGLTGTGRTEMSGKSKFLIIGRDIRLKGEINDCNNLLIEGKADLEISKCQNLTIAESGVLNGVVKVRDADISGFFDGVLKIHGRLLVRAGGKVNGRVKYAEIMIEPGGRVNGQINATDDTDVPDDSAE